MNSEKPVKWSSMMMGIIIVASAFVTINFVSTNVLAYDETIPWNNGYTVNATAQKWFPTPGHSSCLIIMQNGDLTIESGYTLTFNDSVTFQIINDYAGHYGINIESGGQFVINSPNANTEIVSGSTPVTRTYQFLNSGTIDFLGVMVERVYGDSSAKNTTGGIRNFPGSVCKLNKCNI